MKKLSGTESILEEFNEVSKEEWLSKIRDDLRGKEVREMDWDFDETLSIKPFVHADDVRYGSSEIAFNAQWEIAEEFDIIEEAISNHEILEALAGGCEVIMLNVKSLPDWSSLLQGVDLGLIKTYVIPGAEELTQAIIVSLENFLEKSKGKINSGDNSSAPVIHIRNKKNVIGGPAHLHPKKTVVEGLAKTIQEGIQLITQSYDQDTVECVVEIGDTYFIEIARFRALRILWANALAAFGLEKPSLFVEGRFSNRDMSADVHINMIAAGSKALAAISGGVDRLVIAPSDTHPTAFHRRISRNINHILRYESKLDSIDDPVKGSYYIENLTGQLVEQAWSRLIANHE